MTPGTTMAQPSPVRRYGVGTFTLLLYFGSGGIARVSSLTKARLPNARRAGNEPLLRFEFQMSPQLAVQILLAVLAASPEHTRPSVVLEGQDRIQTTRPAGGHECRRESDNSKHRSGAGQSGDIVRSHTEKKAAKKIAGCE